MVISHLKVVKFFTTVYCDLCISAMADCSAPTVDELCAAVADVSIHDTFA